MINELASNRYQFPIRQAIQPGFDSTAKATTAAPNVGEIQSATTAPTQSAAANAVRETALQQQQQLHQQQPCQIIEGDQVSLWLKQSFSRAI